MGYDGKVMHRAQLRYDNDKAERTARFAQKEAAIIAKIPRIGEIDRELRGTMSRIISSALRRGTDPASAIRVLRDENLSLQAEKRQLLEEHGYPPDYLVEKPNCLLC
ncbi:MAG: DNA replication protein DnaC, partial [Oscillospiraceae bacterium]